MLWFYSCPNLAASARLAPWSNASRKWPICGSNGGKELRTLVSERSRLLKPPSSWRPRRTDLAVSPPAQPNSNGRHSIPSEFPDVTVFNRTTWWADTLTLNAVMKIVNRPLESDFLTEWHAVNCIALIDLAPHDHGLCGFIPVVLTVSPKTLNLSYPKWTRYI